MIKKVKSETYSYTFDTKNGFFARWGKDLEDNPLFSPLGPEIVDMEISTICHGLGVPCAFCYKSNTGKGKNMSFGTFKTIFDKLPKNLTQIAFGIGDIDGNPDMIKMFAYCREHGVVPNVTINGFNLSSKMAHQLARYCGAVAVSRYTPKDVCYNAVDTLIHRGIKQVNIHQLAADFTYNSCLELLNDMETEPRLKGLNAVVFLSLKQKGRGKNMKGMDFEKYQSLVTTALDRKLRIGFDSCSANKFLKAVAKRKEFSALEVMAEPCESGLFSAYINVEGKYFPCSFSEGEDGIEGVDLLKIKDFMKEVWMAPSVSEWRAKLLFGCRNCPLFAI